MRDNMILAKETSAGNATATGPVTCKCCGHAFAGKYCNQCGEKVIEPRDLSVRHYFEEIFNAFTSLDTKVWRTVRLVAQVPGGLSRAYMEGRRSPYLKPLSIFFLANVIYFLLPLFETFNSRLQTQLNGRPHSRIATRLVDEYIREKKITRAVFRERYEAKSTENAKLLLIVLVFLIAVPLGVINRGRQPYVAGHITVAFEIMTFNLLFNAIALGVVVYAIFYAGRWLNIEGVEPLLNALVNPFVFVTNGYFLYRAERTFYGCTPRGSLWRTVLIVPSLFAAVGAYRIILFFATFYALG
ncbi:MAG: hypothetical protein AVDCRST_MAG56-1532 [uncultured Cytophagales bacterium]|uniref:DUF3667 domain-containing protein n=1 Tax=uncultured Cytophagales bacterium TaxID=158755 RepID=A0A6J4I7F4_9SPHI|nr:MAG: hypothetical protein AVDCRST_MAG56-1532 [uncultured Cytophagales bacterium]